MTAQNPIEDGAWLDRYSRQIMLDRIGLDGQKRLAGSSVLVVGAGGLGTTILERLAGMGVGRIVVVDRDVIEESNLHRQTMYGDADVGRPKAIVAAERMRRMNAGIAVVPVPAPLTPDNADDLVADCDVAIDALDTAGARYVLNAACLKAGKPLVCGSAVGTEGQAMTVIPGQTACYKCVFGSVDDAEMPKCSTTGVHPSILSIIGGVEAAEAVSVLVATTPALAGRLFHASLDDLEFAKMAVSADPECVACGKGGTGNTTRTEHRQEADAPAGAFARDGIVVEELCGRGGGKRTFAVSERRAVPGGRACTPDEAGRRMANDMGMAVVDSGDGEVVGTGAGGVRISLVGAKSAIIVGAKSPEDAADMYARAVGRADCGARGGRPANAGVRNNNSGGGGPAPRPECVQNA